MAGRSLSAARAAAELERIRSAADTPTPPRSSPADYSPDLAAEAIALADIGMTGAELAAHWAISEETMQQWGEAHPEFADALRRARTRAKAWWQRQPRLAIRAQDNKFPAGAWAQQVRALFPEYADKPGVTVNVDMGQLVQIVRREPDQLTDGQSPANARPLIDHEVVRLPGGLTGEGSPETNLSPDGGPDPDQGGAASAGEGG